VNPGCDRAFAIDHFQQFIAQHFVSEKLARPRWSVDVPMRASLGAAATVDAALVSLPHHLVHRSTNGVEPF